MQWRRVQSLIMLLTVASAAQQSTQPVTVDRERALGQHYASEIRKRSKLIADPVVVAYVNRTGAELAAQWRDSPLDCRFELILGDEGIEPVSLPGCYVLIPVRFLSAAQDEGEFIGMMAHAVAHSALRGSSGIPNGGWLPLHAHSRSTQSLLPRAFLGSQRIRELEADRSGVTLASRAGYDASGFQRYIERTQIADSEMSPLPRRELRLARLREITASLPLRIPASSSEEFRRVQDVVRPIVSQREQPRIPTLNR